MQGILFYNNKNLASPILDPRIGTLELNTRIFDYSIGKYETVKKIDYVPIS